MRGAYDVNDHSLTAVLQHASLDLRGCVQDECPSGKKEICLAIRNALLEVMFLITEQLLLICVARIIMLPGSRALALSMEEV